MAKFDSKSWNPEVWEKYMRKVPNTKENSLIKNGLLNAKPNMTARLRDEVGGNYFTEPVKGLLDGEVLNYDGVTNLTATLRDTFEQGKIIIGRMKGWTEKDFSTELTGEDFMPLAEEVKEYYDSVDQTDLLSILKGIFAMTDTGTDFVAKHTYKVDKELDATDMNKAMQKASGDKKKVYSVAFMHSLVATNLENLNLLNFLKYTDSNGIERDLTIATYNGKLVVVDDEMPTADGYDTATESTPNALKVVASGATAGQINLADVKKASFYPANVKADDYVVAVTDYTTYVLGNQFFDYDNVGVKVPNEMYRDPAKNGGVDTLYTRQRKLFVPKWISFTKASMQTSSPTPAELADGANWVIVNNGKSGSEKAYVNHKLIPVVQIISRG
jgi:hypothetical protein